MNIKLKRIKIDPKPEQDLITGLIVSDKFIREIHPILNIKLLQIPYAKTIARWCLDYFQNYKASPKETIKDIFNSKSKNNNNFNEDEAEMIEKFLSDLSEKYEDYEEFNSQFILDQSEKYLAERKLLLLADDIKTHISFSKYDEAELCVAKHVRTERITGTSIDILKNEQAIISSVDEEQDVLLTYPGDLGKMMGNICKGDFLSFIGPMKRGKSWWLEDFAIRCLFRHLKVLFVSMEMPQNQMMRRIYQNFLGQPKREKKIDIPYFDGGNIEFKTESKKGMKTKDALKKARVITRMIKNGGFRLLCKPQRSMNVEDIKNEIYNLSYYNNFYPDAVVIDYADILAPEYGALKDVRNRIDETWSACRSLAQEINGIVVTVSQSTRGTFSKDVSPEEVAEDIRKMAHITHMFALNQTKEEKKQMVMRLGALAVRNEEFQIDDEVVVLYQYGIGKAYLDSKWKKDVNM